ncbi:hypothetical protein FQA39_LY10903 [Lamprigera yunnana]|nr:hypothetical protein FQA39_LY10903 [Lamprigera yunnana]
MAKWSSTSECGILRKRVVKDKHEDLLVFGYACKLFRDDVKALYIDQGKHLIPWMGEESLNIDRYDCRGALSELQQYEANGENYDTTRWSGLNESERRLELMCDEERYYSLQNNEHELEMYKEEEYKRFHQKGNEVQYNYDVPTDPENSQDSPNVTLPEDEPFVPSPELSIPTDMELPETVKVNAIIEKTALFISKQGPQMEILIKTKQADNSQFKFLNKDDRLHKYYQYLLSAVKSGQYKLKSETSGDENKKTDLCDEEESGDHYLHPSLLTTSVQSAPPPLPTVPYKPSADCKYSQLVNRIQGTHSELTPSPPQPVPDLSQGQMTYEQQQYYQQYYYARQYYEYYKQMSQQFQGHNSDLPQDTNVPLDADNFIQNPVYGTTVLQNQLYAQYFQSNNPYAQIVSNLSQNKDASVSNSNYTQTDTSTDISKAPIIYNQTEPEPMISLKIEMPEPPPPDDIKKPLLSLAQYGSDSENEHGSGDEMNMKIPPSEMEQIISKMASYVLKNGKDFENIVKSKGDPRFDFLNENHEYYSYYRLKVKEYLSEMKIKNEKEEGSVKSKEKKVVTPVSFSIKKPKEETTKEIKSALPVEESDEDLDQPICSPSVPVSVPDNNSTSLTPPPRILKTPSPDEAAGEEAISDKDSKQESDDLILEMIDLTDELEEKRESKRAEHRKKDKIVAVAREKLALQLERKKKAAAFLKLKSVVPGEGEQTSKKHGAVVNTHSSHKHKSKKSQKNDIEVLKVNDSESEEGEIKKHKRSSKKKKTHKRKRSKSRYESKSERRSKEHYKKAKKKQKRSHSRSSKVCGSPE